MQTRRKFLSHVGAMSAAGLMLPSLSFCNEPEQKSKIGFALVGLGEYSTVILAPALKEASNCFLAGVVTGTAAKADKWIKEYNLKKENVYSYENFDSMADNPDIDVVYIVLPNSLHAEFTIRGLQAGKHVICEKPMAMSAAEARTMIAAAQKANRKLSIGYRMHYDPNFVEAKRLGHNEILGPVNYMECALGYFSTPPTGSWKLKKNMGGGPLYNLAVYPIQSARHTKGAMPVFVTAQATTKRKEIFREVDELVAWQLEFGDGTLCSSYSGSAGKIDRLFAACTNGHIELNPATAYNGVAGASSSGRFDFPAVFQQKLQIEDFARCILENKESIVKGEEGLKDMLIIDAILESIRTGKKVRVESREQ